ncbi:hypothetical protein L7F22_007535 [Adiantum nelumboides]|nr:hypothetical protein [Adiantum nelumboides]
MEWSELWSIFGPGLAGAFFGAGWWFWVDVVACSSSTITFAHYLPRIFASFVALMSNCVKRDEIQDYFPYDGGEGCRSRTWLFLAYVISFVSLAGSIGLLIQDALVDSAEFLTRQGWLVSCNVCLF